MVTIPYDDELAVMPDAGPYTLYALRRRTRIAIKQLGLALAEQISWTRPKVPGTPRQRYAIVVFTNTAP